MRMTLVAYLREHGVPAWKANGRLYARNRYTDRNGVAHENEVVLMATWAAVREFLGY